MWRIPLILLVALTTPGCLAVDYAVDPVGCGTGFHEPIFPFYPAMLWDRQLREDVRRAHWSPHESSASRAPTLPVR